MHSPGYQRCDAWRLALALLKQVDAIAEPSTPDPFGFAGKLRGLAADLPLLAAQTYEQLDYDSAQARAQQACDQLFSLQVQASVAAQQGIVCPRQLKSLHKHLDSLRSAFAALPDELFEDDGEAEHLEAA